MRRLLLLQLLLPAATAFGQLDSYTVTVLASRSSSAVPDQATLNVTLLTNEQAGPDDVLAALSGLGITISNLTGIYTQTVDTYAGSGVQIQYRVAWSFALNAPLASLNTQISALANLGSTVHLLTGWNLSYAVQSVQASPSATPQCVIPDVFSDARAQATALASAAGFNVGEVMALSDGSYMSSTQEPAQYQFTNVLTFEVSGIVSPISGSQINVYSAATPGVPACTVVVKFALVGGV